MKQRFFTAVGARSMAYRTSVILTFILWLPVQSVIFGQGSFVTRQQFAKFSLSQRALIFEPTFARIAFEEQVDPNLLWTICYLETRFRPWLRSPAGAEGLMQFIPATARRFNLFNPYQPDAAIRGAAKYVKFLSNRFGARVDSILAGYNAGEGAVDAYLWGRTVRADKKIINPKKIKTTGGVPPYSETTSYVARGLIVYRLLQINRKFPDGFEFSIYPTKISRAVAGVRLNDNEIGFNGSLLGQMNNPQFWNLNRIGQKPMPELSADSNNNRREVLKKEISSRNGFEGQGKDAAGNYETVANEIDTNMTREEKKESESKEIYYEPRTGARYQRQGEKIERLAENGVLVIDEQTPLSPQPQTIRARGTFFGGQISPPK